ncbi:MAG: hypothetical protein ACK45H_02415 [Bacteroidota bacterium]|jgi:hypothetical protein
MNGTMNTRQEIMVNNTVKVAQYKLAQHRIQGTKSKLNIFEVAQLMDAVRTAEQINKAGTRTIFHSVNLN